MPSYRLSPLAEDDLLKIILYTIESRGNEQAKIYSRSIEAALIKLAQYPEFGRQRDELYKNARSFPIEKHIIFYIISDSGIDVARILHQHMDSSKYL